MISAKIYLYMPVACIAFIGLIFGGTSVTAEEAPLELTLSDAILMALENNSAFQVALMKPELRGLQEEQARSEFDPNLSGSITTSGSNGGESDSTNTGVDLEISKKLPTGGDISFGLSTDGRIGGVSGDSSSSRIALSLSHPLFKGAGTDVNMSGIRQAEISKKTSLYELQAYAELLLLQVEMAYLDYALAQRRLKIYEDSHDLAELQLEESRVMIEVGKIAEIELIAAQAEVASRKEALINARSNLDKTRFRLLRLINPPGVEFYSWEITIADELTVREYDVGDIETHMETALVLRPDLNEARLLIERNELDILITKNGLLPNMELFVTLGMSGYSDSFGDSFTNISTGNNDFRFGINYFHTFGENNSRASYEQSVISQDQAYEALNNLTLLAQEDVGVAWIEVNRANEQITATAASRLLQEEKLRAETEKYRVGKSTSLLVGQAQRDYTSSRISEIEAIANYRKAVIELLRNEGTLLEWYGISLMETESVIISGSESEQ